MGGRGSIELGVGGPDLVEIGASGVSQKPPVVRQNIQAGVGDLNQPKAAPESIVAQQTAVNDPLKPSAFSIEAEKLIVPTTDRVALGPHPDQPEGQQTASQPHGSAIASADPRPNGADVLVRAAE